jgi:GDP/UDP-N,N'-diacetylbacillosamine 2-epimerase (hydrolysing)
MKKVKKICVVTGSRAEYGLLGGLMSALHEDDSFKLQVLVTGMHLSPEFGLTYKDIENDGFPITKKVEILLSSDSTVGINKSTGLALISFGEVFDEISPDLVVVLGDRFETFAAAIAAHVTRIPIAHLHGGEKTEGAVDEAFRHSITKLSHLHFTAAEEYRKRVIQLGEAPTRVFSFGAPGIDNILSQELLSREELERDLDLNFKRKNLIVTFHPVTLEKNSAEKQMKELINALDELDDTMIIFTMPNADTDGRIIIELIEEYVSFNKDKSRAFTSLGLLRYPSCLKQVDGVVGNSSSGLIEVPVFKIGTVNIGDRQKGRLSAMSVINCGTKKDDILHAINKIYSPSFQKVLKNVKNPYGSGRVSENIVNILRRTDFSTLEKKAFYDIPVNV